MKSLFVFLVIANIHSLPVPGSYGSCGSAYEFKLQTPFVNELPPGESYTFNPAVSGTSSCANCDCVAETEGRRYIWIRLQYDQVCTFTVLIFLFHSIYHSFSHISKYSSRSLTITLILLIQTQRTEVSVNTFQPPLIWTVSAEQTDANLDVAVIQGESCGVASGCIGGANSGQSKVIVNRATQGFYTTANGQQAGLPAIYGLISTDLITVDDLSAATEAGFAKRLDNPLTRRHRNGDDDDRRLQDLVLDVNVTLDGSAMYEENFNFGTLGVAVKVEYVNDLCVDALSCLFSGAFSEDLPVTVSLPHT